MITMKFGGTSMGDAQRILAVARIVQDTWQKGEKTVVVVSAMSGVTDSLIEAATSASRRDGERFRRIKEQLLARHQTVVQELLQEGERQDALMRELKGLLDGFGDLCQSIYILGELTARGLDAVSSLGERLSARILASLLSRKGANSIPVDGTSLIVTNDHHGQANPLLGQTREKVRAQLLPLLETGVIPVVTGFIGATAEGITTTLGRGGSDYTAAIVGNCLDSDEICIWSDVDGVMTADPKVVKEAKTLAEVSYAEMAELSYFGAKVLHPKTIIPAMEKGIPLRIRNTFKPQHPGTLVVGEAIQTERAVKSIACIKRMSLVTVEGRGMVGVPGVAAKVFSAVAREGISVAMISQSSSERNICFVIPQEATPQALKALEEEFAQELSRRNIDRIWAQGDVAIVAVVGAGMRGTPGIAAKVFGALGRHGINIICIAQGSSEYNISCVIDEKDADDAVNYIHQEFGLGE